MASIGRSALLPQCTSCTRRYTRFGLDNWKPLQQQIRGKRKNAKPSETVTVKLLQDVHRYGRKGSYIPIAPAMMRNTWFPARIADYVPATTIRQLKAQNVAMERDFEFGVEKALLEVEDDEDGTLQIPHYVRPVELDFLSPVKSMELINIFVPPTLDFKRQPIEHESADSSESRLGASGAADILTASARLTAADEAGIYGSVSTADVATMIKDALAENDEAARVILSENDIRFADGPTDGDTTRVKRLGRFKVEIHVRGADAPITRTIQVQARE